VGVVVGVDGDGDGDDHVAGDGVRHAVVIIGHASSVTSPSPSPSTLTSTLTPTK